MMEKRSLFVENLNCNYILNLIDLREKKGSYDVECYFKKNTECFKTMKKLKHFVYYENGYYIVNFWIDPNILFQKNLSILKCQLNRLADVLGTKNIIVPDFFDMELWQIIYDVFHQNDISAFFISNHSIENNELIERKMDSRMISRLRNI